MTVKKSHNTVHIIYEKKRLLTESVSVTLDLISKACQAYLDNSDELDNYLSQIIKNIPDCSAIYVTDCNYLQVSSNIHNDKILKQYRGQSLSNRPYLQSTIPLKGLVLSDIYQDRFTFKAYISLIQAIQKEGRLVRLLITDFALDDLPSTIDAEKNCTKWQQFKGDPAIRGGLFSQQRSTSIVDLNIDKAHDIAKKLVVNNAVFHIKFHYSSSRVCLWLFDKPHFYQLHNIEELLNGTVFACYPQQVCTDAYNINIEQIKQVLSQFKSLRFADENIYLRSASLNIINQMVGLNFSCDGSHYIPVEEFLDKKMDYWLG